MQTTRCLISTFFEFTAKLQEGHHTFQRRDFASLLFGQLLVNVRWNSSAIIQYRY